MCWGCLRYRSPGWSAGGWNGCERCCRREIGCVLKFRHGIPVALGHIAHPQLGIFPFFDGNGVVKSLPQQPVVGLRFIRRSHLKICQRTDHGLSGGIEQRLVVGAVVNEKFFVLIAGAEVTA